MKLSAAKSSVNLAPTIDDVDPSLTPSLVGYWKCNDGSGLLVRDYSGNGYDLSIECPDYLYAGEENTATPENIAICWDSFPGFFTPWNGVAAMRDIAEAPLLDTGSNFVIFGCEQIANLSAGNADFDCGTYWAGAPAPVEDVYPATGFNWALAFTQHWFRFTSEVSPGVYHGAAITDANCFAALGSGTFPDNSTVGVCGCFEPGTAVSAAMYGVDKQEVGPSLNAPIGYSRRTATTSPAGQPIPSTLQAQGSKFGLRGQVGGSWSPTSGLRNFYVWSFASEPPQLASTVKWLAMNPGRIPPWWIGR